MTPDPEYLERAARILCAKRGQNPDELVGHGAEPSPDGYVPDIYLQSPRYRLVMREVQDFINLMQSCEDAKLGFTA